MVKVVVNSSFGLFKLSKAAYEYLGLEWDGYGYADVDRTDPKLIAAIEELGAKVAGGSGARLRIAEVPDDVSWHINEYDGQEWVAEDHRTW
jgi:hypothetical protein